MSEKMLRTAPGHANASWGRGLAASLLAAGLLLGAHAAFAQGEAVEPQQPRLEQMLERYKQSLELDEDTRAAIDRIAGESRTEREQIRSRLRPQYRELRRLLEQDSPDEAAIMKQAELIGALQAEHQKQRLRTILSIRALLTPEQRQELVQIGQQERAMRDDAPDELAPALPEP